MASQYKNSWNVLLILLFVLSFLSVIGASFYRYYYKKDYKYLLEASCDPATESCFVRDCENPDDCPPNQLTIYKQFKIRASDFAGCTDNSCIEQCATGTIACEVVYCDPVLGDDCVLPEQSDVTSQ